MAEAEDRTLARAVYTVAFTIWGVPTLPAASRGERLRVYRPSATVPPPSASPDQLAVAPAGPAGRENDRTVAPYALITATSTSPVSLVFTLIVTLSWRPSPF